MSSVPFYFFEQGSEGLSPPSWRVTLVDKPAKLLSTDYRALIVHISVAKKSEFPEKRDKHDGENPTDTVDAE
jgi:hypothetical protein